MHVWAPWAARTLRVRRRQARRQARRRDRVAAGHLGNVRGDVVRLGAVAGGALGHVRVPLVANLGRAGAAPAHDAPAVVFAHVRLVKGRGADVGLWARDAVRAPVVRVRRGGRGLAARRRHGDGDQLRLLALAAVVEQHAKREQEHGGAANGDAGNGAAAQYSARRRRGGRGRGGAGGGGCRRRRRARARRGCTRGPPRRVARRVGLQVEVGVAVGLGRREGAFVGEADGVELAVDGRSAADVEAGIHKGVERAHVFVGEAVVLARDAQLVDKVADLRLIQVHVFVCISYANRGGATRSRKLGCEAAAICEAKSDEPVVEESTGKRDQLVSSISRGVNGILPCDLLLICLVCQGDGVDFSRNKVDEWLRAASI